MSRGEVFIHLEGDDRAQTNRIKFYQSFVSLFLLKCVHVSKCVHVYCWSLSNVFLETIRIAGGGSGAEKNILSKFGKSETGTGRRGQKQPILSQLSQLSWL